MANDRDPRSDLGAWLGEELRRARLDAGFTSQDQFARELGFDRTVIVKAETGRGLRPKTWLPRSRRCSLACATACTSGSRQSPASPTGRFRGGSRTGSAVSVRLPRCGSGSQLSFPAFCRQPSTRRRCSLASARASMLTRWRIWLPRRIGRQAIFDKPEPPHLWVVLDEAVLHRLIGSPKVMYDQLTHLAEMSERSAS